MNEDIYGRGLAYPLQTSAKGGLAESAGIRKIEESIRMILGTNHGERVMRPRFGCNLKALVFAPNNTATANLARIYVEEGLRRWEPHIELVALRIENDNRQGHLLIDISYRVRATQEVASLVYRFNLEQPT
jgi:hypothetical protein